VSTVLRVDIHLCATLNCPEPPDFLVGIAETPMCKSCYRMHAAVERAQIEARRRELDGTSITA